MLSIAYPIDLSGHILWILFSGVPILFDVWVQRWGQVLVQIVLSRFRFPSFWFTLQDKAILRLGNFDVAETEERSDCNRGQKSFNKGMEGQSRLIYHCIESDAKGQFCLIQKSWGWFSDWIWGILHSEALWHAEDGKLGIRSQKKSRGTFLFPSWMLPLSSHSWQHSKNPIHPSIHTCMHAYMHTCIDA